MGDDNFGLYIAIVQEPQQTEQVVDLGGFAEAIEDEYELILFVCIVFVGICRDAVVGHVVIDKLAGNKREYRRYRLFPADGVHFIFVDLSVLYIVIVFFSKEQAFLYEGESKMCDQVFPVTDGRVGFSMPEFYQRIIIE